MPIHQRRGGRSTTTAGKPGDQKESPAEVKTLIPIPLSEPADSTIACCVFVVAFAIYFRTLHPSVAGGDSGELMVVAHEMGTPHPPGYPTFAILTKAAELVSRALSTSIPIGLAMNTFHALLSSAAVSFLYLGTSRMTGSAAAGLVSSFVFGFAPNVWSYAIITEVFALNNFFMCLLILLSVEFWRCKMDEMNGNPSRMNWRLRLSAFICGLSLTNQHTSVLFVFPIIFWVLLLDLRRTLRDTPALCCCFALGLLPYVYLPISSRFVITKNSWGKLDSWISFWDHFFRKDYGTFSLASKEANYRVQNFARAWRFYAYDCVEQTLWCLWIFAVIGALLSLARAYRAMRITGIRYVTRLPVSVVLIGVWLLYCNFFHYLANLPIDQPLFYGVQQRFWPQPLILVSMNIGVGIDWVFHKAHLSRRLQLIAALMIASAQVLVHFSSCDESANFYVRDFGVSLLSPLPSNSILLTKGDIQINAARYVQVVEGLRPDVVIMDQELLTYEWYNEFIRATHPDIVLPGTSYFPGRPGLYNMKQLLRANMKDGRRVFIAWGWKEGDPSTANLYHLVPFGSATEVLPEKLRLRLEKDASLRAMRALEVAGSIHNLDGRRIPPRGRYSDVSWEHVVREDFKYHLISVAFDAVKMTETNKDAPYHGVASALDDSGPEGCANATERFDPGPRREQAMLYCALLKSERIYEYILRTFSPDELPYYVRRNFCVLLQVKARLQTDTARLNDVKRKLLQHLKLNLEESAGQPKGDQVHIEKVIEAVEMVLGVAN